MSMIIRRYAITFMQDEVTLFTPEANQQVKITPIPVNTPNPDSGGRLYTLAHNCKVEFALMGNANVDYSELYNVLLANEKLDVQFEDEEDSSQNILFEQVSVNPEPVLDGDGKYEGIKCSFTRLLSKTQFASLFGAAQRVWISGNIKSDEDPPLPKQGVVLIYSVGGVAKSATTDENGDYSFPVPYNWSGTVTPKWWGNHSAFIPVNKSYNSIKVNQVNQDYVVGL